MRLHFTNPETSVGRRKRPHETWAQICNTRTEHSKLHTLSQFRNAHRVRAESICFEMHGSILTLRSLKSTKPVAHLWHHAYDTCRSRQYWQLHVLAHAHRHSISASHTDTQTRTHEFCPGTKVVSKEAQRHCARAPHGAP